MAQEKFRVNGEVLETVHTSLAEDYRSQWDVDEDVEEVDAENMVAPQYSKHYPEAGGFPDEFYEECMCIPVDEAREKVSIGDEILFWNSPPFTDEVLWDSTVRELPPVDYAEPGEGTIKSKDHLIAHNGRPMSDGLFGPIQHQVRMDMIVAINPEKV